MTGLSRIATMNRDLNSAMSFNQLLVKEKTLIFGMVRDVTEKRNAAEALRRAVGEIEVLLEECRSWQMKAERAAIKK